jgi:hypothetical protein
VWTDLRKLKLSKKSGRPMVKETPRSRTVKEDAARAKGSRVLEEGDREDLHITVRLNLRRMRAARTTV